MSLENIYKPIKNDLKKVEKLLQQSLFSKDQIIKKITFPLSSGKGKMIRPALVLLSSVIFKKINKSSIDFAVACELVHDAALVHDDIIDKEKIRRGKKTINYLWGNQIAVLFGDYIYAKASEIVAGIGNKKISIILANTIYKMCVGEIKESATKFKSDISEEFYMEIIKEKTAVLFSACCEIGAILAGASQVEVRKMSNYGRNLGMAFQIRDDILDFASDGMTLPLIYVWQVAAYKDKKTIEQFFTSNGNNPGEKIVKEIAQKYKAFNYSLKIAQRYAFEAVSEIEHFKNSQAKQSLTELAHYAIIRDK